MDIETETLLDILDSKEPLSEEEGVLIGQELSDRGIELPLDFTVEII